MFISDPAGSDGRPKMSQRRICFRRISSVQLSEVYSNMVYFQGNWFHKNIFTIFFRSVFVLWQRGWQGVSCACMMYGFYCRNQVREMDNARARFLVEEFLSAFRIWLRTWEHLHPRKLTWLDGVFPPWMSRCISYSKMGIFQPVMFNF